MEIIVNCFCRVYESKLELNRSADGDGGLDAELELLLVTLWREPDCMSTTLNKTDI